MCPVDAVLGAPPVDSPGVVGLGDDSQPTLVERRDLNPTSHCDTVGEIEGRIGPAVNIVVETIKAHRLADLTRRVERHAVLGAVVAVGRAVVGVVVELIPGNKTVSVRLYRLDVVVVFLPVLHATRAAANPAVR
jgi:hypothetical protein